MRAIARPDPVFRAKMPEDKVEKKGGNKKYSTVHEHTPFWEPQRVKLPQ